MARTLLQPNHPAQFTNFIDGLFDPEERPRLVRTILLKALSHEMEERDTVAQLKVIEEIGAIKFNRNDPLFPFVAWLITAEERRIILDRWIDAWFQNQCPASCHASDHTVLRFLHQYIERNDLDLFVPRLAFNGFRGGQVMYRLGGYDRHQLLLRQGTGQAAKDQRKKAVRLFLTLLAAGAHFVAVHSHDDAGTRPNAFNPLFNDANVEDLFQSVTTTLTMRKATGHSHYCKHLGGKPAGVMMNLGAAYIYPSTVTTESAPVNCPLIVSLLFGRTDYGVVFSGEHNTFFQLEGWPTVGMTGGKRHGADFQTHGDTKWNISTFGASAFSEKRGATVFLAPSDWNPQPNANTVMAPYKGASGQAQGWLDTGLICR